MKRLTLKRNSDGSASQPLDLNWAAVLDKLTTYEDLEEKGLLLKLPFKIGDKVYEIQWDEEESWIEEYTITNFYFGKGGVQRIFATHGTKSINFRPKRIGINYFRTREEAEKAMENME